MELNKEICSPSLLKILNYVAFFFSICAVDFPFPSLSYPIGGDMCDQVASKLMENNDSVLLDWPVGRD